MKYALNATSKKNNTTFNSSPMTCTANTMYEQDHLCHLKFSVNISFDRKTTDGDAPTQSYAESDSGSGIINSLK